MSYEDYFAAVIMISGGMIYNKKLIKRKYTLHAMKISLQKGVSWSLFHKDYNLFQKRLFRLMYL